MKYLSCSQISKFFLNINGRIDIEEPVINLCCEVLPDGLGIPGIAFQATPEETLQKYLGMRWLVLLEGLQRAQSGTASNRFTSGCEHCVNYQVTEDNFNLLISYVNLSMYPSPCQCKCIYCKAPRGWENTKSVIEGYEKTFAMLELAKECGAIASNARWQVSAGEITIHPYRERIMNLVKKQATCFYTNCFLFDEDIAQNLHDNPNSSINISIDAGIPETWKKVKGFDNFEKVTTNLVEYHNRSARAGQITFKYIVLPDVNDTYEDYISLVEIMKILEVPHLSISRDVLYKYTASSKERTKLLGAAAYLAAICHKNGITADFYTYSPEEREIIAKLANEVLQKI